MRKIHRQLGEKSSLWKEKEGWGKEKEQRGRLPIYSKSKNIPVSAAQKCDSLSLTGDRKTTGKMFALEGQYFQNV